MPDESKNLRSHYAVFFEYSCNVDGIEIPGLGELDRTDLGNLLIFFDLIIITWFVVHWALQTYWVQRDASSSERIMV